MEDLEAHRAWYARLVTAGVGVPVSTALREAFASVPREDFLGPGPWSAFTRGGYVETPSNDPALVYHDIPLAIDASRRINNGQPSLHAVCLASLAIQPGETIVHVGAGTGYYSAVIAALVGKAGRVVAYEIDERLAERASRDLTPYPWVEVRCGSGATSTVPPCDVLYVNAGASAPLATWTDALRPGGRLLFPLTPGLAPGYMLLVTRTQHGFAARFVCSASFIPCVDANDEAEAAALAEAYRRGDLAEVRSLRRGTPPAATAWLVGSDWWLSRSEPCEADLSHLA